MQINKNVTADNEHTLSIPSDYENGVTTTEEETPLFAPHDNYNNIIFKCGSRRIHRRVKII